MSDVEEPPTKMSKFEEEEYLEPEEEEGLEEGQEEWLSEGVLTDDDYVQNTEQGQLKAEVSMDGSQETLEELDNLVTIDGTEINVAMATEEEQKESNLTENIEEQLNNLESSQNGEDLNDELDTFLIRKNDGVNKANKYESNMDTDKQREDDGNDTDDLLRMLGEDNQKIKKKTLKVVKSEKVDDHGSSDDDDFVYERSQVKTLKLAKNALIKRPATKAVPEDMSDGDDESDQSSDEGSTVQRMFEMQAAASSGGKTETQKKIVKHVVHIDNRNQKQDQKPLKQHTQQKQVQQKPNFTSNKSNVIQKPVSSTPKPSFGSQKPILKTPKPIPQLLSKLNKSVEIKTPAPFTPLDKVQKDKVQKPSSKHESQKNDDFDDVIDEEEFLEEDEFDLDEEEFAEQSEGDTSKKQRIMKPEVMDEEVPSDAESRSEDGSLYDELPSSDSEDLDDWFTLDIRAERAGDYLPLLGTKARELLLAERRRVSSRVATLRQSLSALTDSARRQADQLRAAAMALAEIDDTLRAA
ncbi:unnamed protein product [Spodoptera exigua]|nr:unnamed protein product [Spodoptera exigua]